MSGSKSVKVIGCQYKFKQGKNKGKICKAPCRGKFCKNHNENRLKYISKYSNQKVLENKNSRIKKEIKEIKKSEDEDYLNKLLHKKNLKKMHYLANFMVCLRKIYSINNFLGQETSESIINYIEKNSKRGIKNIKEHKGDCDKKVDIVKAKKRLSIEKENMTKQKEKLINSFNIIKVIKNRIDELNMDNLSTTQIIDRLEKL